MHPLIISFEPRESTGLVIQKPEHRHQCGDQNKRQEKKAGDLPTSDIAKWKHLGNRGDACGRCADQIDIFRNHEIEAGRIDRFVDDHIA